MLSEHDVVALTVARPQDELCVGAVGAVVHLYAGRDVYEVEFVDENGNTKCVVTATGSELMRRNLLSLSA